MGQLRNIAIFGFFYSLCNTVKPLFSRGSIFRGFRDFLKIRENQTREKLPNSMIIVEKTREPRTLDPAESYKAADREK